MPVVPEIRIDLEELNHTELVLLLRWIGVRHATRAMPREMLIEALETVSPVEAPNPVDVRRKAMSEWLKLHWDRLQMQAPKAVCPNCYECGDLQALECFNNNITHLGGG